MKKILQACFLLFFMHPAIAQDMDREFEPTAITAAVAAKYAVYAMLSSNVYHKNDRLRFPVEKLGWVQVDVYGRPTTKPTTTRKSGLAYDIYEQQDSNEVIFVFRGTDSKKDYLTGNLAIWPFSLQYTQAKIAFEKYLKNHPTKKVSVAGHSLGGGLALSMSVRYGVDAVVFDSSPRIFDGLGNKHLPASRVMIYEGGEILAVVRKFWRKIFEVVPQENIYKASFDFGSANKHRSDHLALGLLNLGASEDATLVAIRDSLPK